MIFPLIAILAGIGIGLSLRRAQRICLQGQIKELRWTNQDLMTHIEYLRKRHIPGRLEIQKIIDKLEKEYRIPHESLPTRIVAADPSNRQRSERRRTGGRRATGTAYRNRRKAVGRVRTTRRGLENLN